MIAFLVRLTRWKEWYESKVPLFFLAGYTWLLPSTQPAGQALTRFLVWIVFSALYLAFGYALNDFFDRDIDRQVDKPNAIGELNTSVAIGWLLAIAGIGLVSLVPFYRERWVVVSVAASYIFAVTYSMPPIRFKERGVLGVLVSALAQRSLPLLVGMAVFQDFRPSTWFLVLLFSLIGVRWIIVHQLVDLLKDERAQVNTFARTYGHDRTLWLMKVVVFPLELTCLVGWFVLALRQLPMLFLLISIYGLWLFAKVPLRKEDSSLFTWTQYGRLPLTNFYLILWPFLLGMLLVIREPIYLVLVLLQIIWQWPYLRNQLLKFWHLLQARYTRGMIR